MTSFLEGSLAAGIGAAFADIFLDATLTQTSVYGGKGYDPTTSTTAMEHPCKAMVDTYSQYQIAMGAVQANDRKVLVLAASLGATPQPNDTIQIRGASYNVKAVAIDPALAVWELQGRL